MQNENKGDTYLCVEALVGLPFFFRKVLDTTLAARYVLTTKFDYILAYFAWLAQAQAQTFILLVCVYDVVALLHTVFVKCASTGF